MKVPHSLFFAAIMIFLATWSSAESQETEKPNEVTAYEECAARVFARSQKVSDVFAECEPEMERYLALKDERMREKIRQRAMANTQRALRSSGRND